MAEGKVIKLGILLELLDRVTGPGRKISKSFLDVEKNAKLADRAVSIAQKNWSAGWKMMATGGVLAAPFIYLGNQIIKTGTELEDLKRIAIQVMGGDTVKGLKLLEYIKAFEDITPFEKMPLMDAATTLERMGMSAQKWLPRITDIAVVVGRLPNEVASMFARAKAMGTARSLFEIGIGKPQLIAAGLKGGIDDIMDQSKMLRLLWNVSGGKGFAGATERAMNGPGGLWKRASEAWEKFREGASDIEFPKLIEQLRKIVGIVESPAFQAGILRWAKIAANAFGLVIDWAGKLLKPIMAIILWIDKLAKTHPKIVEYALALAFAGTMSLFALGAIRMLTAGAYYALGAIFRLIAFLGSIPFKLFAIRYYGTLIFGPIISGAASAATAVWGFFSSATAAVWSFLATNPIGWVLLVISAVIMFALAWKNNWLGIGAFMNKVVLGIAGGFTWLWNQITAGVYWLFSLPGKFYDAGKKMILSLWEGIKSVAMGPINAVRNIAQRIMDLWPHSPAKEGPLRYLGNVGNAFGDQISTGILNNVGRIRRAAIIAALAAMPIVNFPALAAGQITATIISANKSHAAYLKAMGSMPPTQGFRKGAFGGLYRTQEDLQLGLKGLYNIPSGLSPELGMTPMSIPSGLGPNDLLGGGGQGNFSGLDNMGDIGGATAVGSQIIYITQHFERESIILTGDIKNFEDLADKIGKQLVRKIVMETK